MWICDKIFEWYNEGGGFRIEIDKLKRAYQLLLHAENLLDKAPNEFFLSDSISNLKRCLNQRLKLIEEIYQFKKIAFINKPKGYLELLELLGLVRPFILKELMYIRNEIEHNNLKPPDINRCRELLDITWYFLKSTDSIVRRKFESFYYYKLDKNGFETQYGFDLYLNIDKNITAKISGWFPQNYVIQHEMENYFRIEIDKMSSGKEVKDSDKSEDRENLLDTDVFISGIIFSNEKQNSFILRKCLGTI